MSTSVDQNVTFASARTQERMIREGQISAVELFDASINMVERFNAVINAVVCTQIERAREDALKADEELRRGVTRGPLHGLPITVKESFNWEGSPTTLGDPRFVNNIADYTAVAVKQLQRAGAIVYGKTNVPLHLAEAQSFNDIYGTTNNPWDLARTVGGSSGGSAAALASGMTSLELGSDIAGSVRNPAHYCGVFSHKPTFGLISQEGHGLPGSPAAMDISVVGPMGRSAGDIDLAMSVLAGANYRSSGGARSLSDFRVGVVLESPFLTQDPELTEHLQEGVSALQAAGLNATFDAMPDFDLEHYFDVNVLLLRAATGSAKSTLPPEEKLAFDLARFYAGDRDRPAMEARGYSLTHREWWHLNNERELERQSWARYFTQYDLLLCPTSPSAAFKHDHRPDRFEGKILPGSTKREEPLFWALWPGVAYLPSTIAPTGLTRSGLPCGIQIVAPHGQDALSIQFAALVEQVLGGFRPAPMLTRI